MQYFESKNLFGFSATDSKLAFRARKLSGTFKKRAPGLETVFHVDGERSVLKDLHRGVRHGSVLRPILYLLYSIISTWRHYRKLFDRVFVAYRV